MAQELTSGRTVAQKPPGRKANLRIILRLWRADRSAGSKLPGGIAVKAADRARSSAATVRVAQGLGILLNIAPDLVQAHMAIMAVRRCSLRASITTGMASTLRGALTSMDITGIIITPIMAITVTASMAALITKVDTMRRPNMASTKSTATMDMLITGDMAIMAITGITPITIVMDIMARENITPITGTMDVMGAKPTTEATAMGSSMATRSMAKAISTATPTTDSMAITVIMPIMGVITTLTMATTSSLADLGMGGLARRPTSLRTADTAPQGATVRKGITVDRRSVSPVSTVITAHLVPRVIMAPDRAVPTVVPVGQADRNIAITAGRIGIS